MSGGRFLAGCLFLLVILFIAMVLIGLLSGRDTLTFK